MDELTDAEKQALTTTLLGRIDVLKGIEGDTASEQIKSMARTQIDLLVSAAQKLQLP